jgi:hypothetical protein
MKYGNNKNTGHFKTPVSEDLHLTAAECVPVPYLNSILRRIHMVPERSFFLRRKIWKLKVYLEKH